MTKLLRLTDRACGYVFQGELAEQDSALSLFTSAMGRLPTELETDVQERWLDAREEYDEHENQLWKEEGEIVAEEENKRQQQPHLRPTANTYSGSQKPAVQTTKRE